MATTNVLYLYILLTLSIVSIYSCSEIKPFTINISQKIIDDLKTRLSVTRFPDQLEDVKDWSYGIELNYTKELANYWKDTYDWRKQEKYLNQFSHFTTKIDDIEVHFIHSLSNYKNATPIIISHGWPGSFMECLKAIPQLTQPENYGKKPEDAFHVICPSIPGFGFSSAPKKQGFNIIRVADLYVKLMARLGYNKYIAQGGDYGFYVATFLGVLDPQHCIGVHVNMIMVPPIFTFRKGYFTPIRTLIKLLKPEWFYEKHVVEHLKFSLQFFFTGLGYMIEQATKPQTLGYGLSDSPIGLAAWIVEKFQEWSDCNGNVENKFTKDELITNVMIYWVTNSITSSARMYKETIPMAFGDEINNFYVTVPTACAIFPKEVGFMPRDIVELYYNVVRWTDFKSGGHFALLEETANLVEDIRQFKNQITHQQSIKQEL